MKRSIFLFALGTLMLAAGQIGLSLSVHPERGTSLRFFLQTSLGLVFGSAIAASGMLGLADRYEKAAGQLAGLLKTRRTPEEANIPVKDSPSLRAHNQNFWKAYFHSGLSVGLFLTGLLVIAVLSLKTRFLFYLFFIGAGAALLGLFASILLFQALRALLHLHRDVADSAQTLAQQPERPSGRPRAEESEVQWVVQRKGGTSYTRRLEPRKKASRPSLRS